MDQQFALVVYADPLLKKDLIKIIERKKSKGDIELVSGKFLIGDSAGVLFGRKDGLLLFEINAENFDEVFEAVSQIRRNGAYLKGASKFMFPDNLKMIFTIDKIFLEGIPSGKREKVLYVFSPVYSE